jgi:hypothetical protein
VEEKKTLNYHSIEKMILYKIIYIFQSIKLDHLHRKIIDPSNKLWSPHFYDIISQVLCFLYKNVIHLTENSFSYLMI